MTSEQTATKTETILFVAYGTLRKGEALHEGWIGSEIVNDLGPVFIKGAKLHYATSHRSFPVLRWTGDISDKAVGELYELKLSEQTIEMLTMESRAGYSIVEASVETPEGELAQATVCIWPHPYGDEVPNNDWCSVERREWWR